MRLREPEFHALPYAAQLRLLAYNHLRELERSD